MTLRNSASSSVCSKHDLAPDGTEFVGIGLIPDVVIEESSKSYFDPKRDDLIAAAIRHLKSKSARQRNK